jgi:hypothetical protein
LPDDIFPLYDGDKQLHSQHCKIKFNPPPYNPDSQRREKPLMPRAWGNSYSGGKLFSNLIFFLLANRKLHEIAESRLPTHRLLSFLERRSAIFYKDMEWHLIGLFRTPSPSLKMREHFCFRYCNIVNLFIISIAVQWMCLRRKVTEKSHLFHIIPWRSCRELNHEQHAAVLPSAPSTTTPGTNYVSVNLFIFPRTTSKIQNWISVVSNFPAAASISPLRSLASFDFPAKNIEVHIKNSMYMLHRAHKTRPVSVFPPYINWPPID